MVQIHQVVVLFDGNIVVSLLFISTNKNHKPLPQLFPYPPKNYFGKNKSIQPSF